MFAMLGGAAGAWGEIGDVVAAQVAAGLEVVTDGRETIPPEAAAAATIVDDLLAGRGTGSVEAWLAVVAAAEYVAVAAADVAGETPTPAVAVAAAIPGPYSLARRSFGEEPDPAVAAALARALAREAAALGTAGCALVRIDEPDALAPASIPRERASFIAAHAALVAGATAGAAPGAAPDAAGPHLMLALAGGEHEGIGATALADLGYASYLFDLIAGPNDWRLIAVLPRERGVVCGVVDGATTTGDTPEILVWAALYAASTKGRGLARVGLATTGSLAALEPAAALAKIRALGEGARVAALSADEMRASLDPRALDMRSAALGAWDPAHRPGRGRRV